MNVSEESISQPLHSGEETQGWALAVSEASPIPCPHLSPLYIGGLASPWARPMEPGRRWVSRVRGALP